MALTRCWNVGIEPPLEEVLSDPMVQLVAERDGLTATDLRRAVEQARLALPKVHAVGNGATTEALPQA